MHIFASWPHISGWGVQIFANGPNQRAPLASPRIEEGEEEEDDEEEEEEEEEEEPEFDSSGDEIPM